MDDSNSVWLGIGYSVSSLTAVLEFPDGRLAALTFDGDARLPAGVAVTHDGVIHVGKKTAQLGDDFPELYLGEPGRHVDAVSVRVGEHDKPAVDLVAAALRLVWDEAVRTSGGRVSDVMIAVPPSLRAHGAALSSAAVRAGMPRPAVVDSVEAVARQAMANGVAVPDGDLMAVVRLDGAADEGASFTAMGQRCIVW